MEPQATSPLNVRMFMTGLGKKPHEYGAFIKWLGPRSQESFLPSAWETLYLEFQQRPVRTARVR